MDASEEILMNSLANSGVPIPAGISTFDDLNPSALFSICSAALLLIDGPTHASSFPLYLPEDSMPDRIKICTDIAAAFNKLGFTPELSFHEFLYPSKQDLYKLVRFLVRKLSESSGARTAALEEGDKVSCLAKPDDDSESVQTEGVLTGLQDQRLNTPAHGSSYIKSQDDLAQRFALPNSVSENVEIRVEETRSTKRDLCPSESCCGNNPLCLAEGIESSQKNASIDQDGPKIEVLQNKEKVLTEQVMSKSSEVHYLEEELALLKPIVEVVLDGQHPIEFYIEQLSNQVEAKRIGLKELESKWNAIENPLLERKRNLEQALLAVYPEVSGILMRKKEIQLETESILAEIKRREEELCKLSSDLEKQPKLAPRRSYIERITEITKNSRKQDAEIQRIVKDTRELQLESNTIQERLNRTYAIVDETIFREAKKDHVARQAYRLLKNIHESFEQIAENILATDRTRRDVADYEAKLAIITARNLNTVKLQADLDAIRKENELLEQRLRNI